METGFTNYKDILDVVIIPITLAVLAVLFPAIKSWYLRRRFKKLILRELQEISPYPLEKTGASNTWISHQQKKCIHKEIFNNASENRDFILSLPPDLVYYLANFWDSKNGDDPKAKQWLNYLNELNKYFNDARLSKVYNNWENLIAQYQETS